MLMDMGMDWDGMARHADEFLSAYYGSSSHFLSWLGTSDSTMKDVYLQTSIPKYLMTLFASMNYRRHYLSDTFRRDQYLIVQGIW